MNSHSNTLASVRLAIQAVVDAFDKLPARHPGRMARLYLNGLRDAIDKINAAQTAPVEAIAEEPTTLLVVWSIKIGNQVTDHWTACEDEQAALDKYNKLCETDGIYSVSICKPVRSTDY